MVTVSHQDILRFVPLLVGLERRSLHCLYAQLVVVFLRVPGVIDRQEERHTDHLVRGVCHSAVGGGTFAATRVVNTTQMPKSSTVMKHAVASRQLATDH